MKMRFIVMRATFIMDFIFHRAMRHFFINENLDQHLVPTISNYFQQFPTNSHKFPWWKWENRDESARDVMKIRFIVMRAAFITDFIFIVWRGIFHQQNSWSTLGSHNFPQFPTISHNSRDENEKIVMNLPGVWWKYVSSWWGLLSSRILFFIVWWGIFHQRKSWSTLGSQNFPEFPRNSQISLGRTGLV